MVSYIPLQKRGRSLTWCISGDVLKAAQMGEAEQHWPKTLDEAVDQLLLSMSDEEKEEFRNTPKQEFTMFHHGL